MRILGGEELSICDLCEKTFSKALRKKTFKCKTCEKDFSQQSDLTVHKRIHTSEKPFKCETCEKAFSNKGHLTVHRRMHTGDKPYSCDACKKSFYTNSELINHKWMNHTDLKHSYCELCQKSYYSNSDLPKHNESVGHLRKLKSAEITSPPSTSTSFVDCGKADVKLEIKEEETLDDDPLSISWIS